MLDTIEREGAERLSAMLREQAIQDAMARGVNDAIVDFLGRPVASVLGDPEDPSVHEAQATLTGWAVGLGQRSGYPRVPGGKTGSGPGQGRNPDLG